MSTRRFVTTALAAALFTVAGCAAEPTAPAPVGPEYAPRAFDVPTISALIAERGAVTVLVRGPSDLRGPAAIAQWRQGVVADLDPGVVLRTYRNLPAIAVAMDAETLAVLQGSPAVHGLELNISRPMATPAPPAQPGPVRSSFDNWHVEMVGADVTRRQGHRGEGQTIVVVDSGIDASHPLLKGRVVDGACFSTNGIGRSSVCPGGAAEAYGVDAGEMCDVEPCEHGTHVAGIAAGTVARGADLVSVQVATRYDDCSSIGGPAGPCAVPEDDDVLAALDHVLTLAETQPIASVNVSIGGGAYMAECPNDLRAETIARLREAGVATVVSSGNEYHTDRVSAPACVDEAIAVGSTNRADQVSVFSNGGPQVDLLAPGQAIESSLPDRTMGAKSGTSMAAPHVAGAVAVLRGMDPELTVDEIEEILKTTGTEVTDVRNGRTTPRLQLDAAAELLAE